MAYMYASTHASSLFPNLPLYEVLTKLDTQELYDQNEEKRSYQFTAERMSSHAKAFVAGLFMTYFGLIIGIVTAIFVFTISSKNNESEDVSFRNARIARLKNKISIIDRALADFSKTKYHDGVHLIVTQLLKAKEGFQNQLDCWNGQKA